MLRKIIHIDTEKCTGCGVCASACHEGAIEIVNGKAVLTRESCCDGLGDCLPACPAGAISFEGREAPAYDEAAVRAARSGQKPAGPPRGCPGMEVKRLECGSKPCRAGTSVSRLAQWPVQIKLVPASAPYYDGADLLIAADCTAYACGDFHERFMAGRITLIGCTKLDAMDYSEKLTQIITQNNIKSITVARMQVPCCGGMENAVRNALIVSGKSIPMQIAVITADGRVIN